MELCALTAVRAAHFTVCSSDTAVQAVIDLCALLQSLTSQVVFD